MARYEILRETPPGYLQIKFDDTVQTAFAIPLDESGLPLVGDPLRAWAITKYKEVMLGAGLTLESEMKKIVDITADV